MTSRGAGSAFLALFVMLLAVAAPCWAEAPDVKFLVPSGLQQGQVRTLKVNGKAGTPPLQIWTSNERLTATADEKGETLSVTAAADLPAGVYWLRVCNAAGASGLLPLIVGLLLEVTEDELHRKEEPVPLSLPTTISGVLAKSGEVDQFDVPLAAGQTLIASIDSRRLLASPADVVLQLADERGFVIAQNDDHHGFDPQIVHTAASEGTYTVRVFAFPADPNSTIRFAGGSNYVYRLTLTTGPFVDHLFPLAIAAEGETLFQERGWNLPAAESPLTATPGETVGIRVTNRHPGSLLINRWQTSLRQLLSEPAADDAAEPLELPVPAAVCGRLDTAGGTDVYRFAAAKDQTLRLSVVAQAFDSPLDPVLTIRDADGKRLKQADDIAKGNSDVRLDVKFPADGTYTAEVSDRYGHGGMSSVYLLSLEPPAATFRLSVDETRFTVTAEKPLEIPVTIARQDGFGETIVVEVQELPEGITAEPVESTNEGETTKKVTLKIATSGATPHGGLIRIVGRSGESPPVAATADTPIVGLKIADVWLTAVATKPDAESEDSEPANQDP